VSNNVLLETALAVGEEITKKNIVLELRLRRTRWAITKARYQLASGKANDALKTLDVILEAMKGDTK
jgi:hypothetical protein